MKLFLDNFPLISVPEGLQLHRLSELVEKISRNPIPTHQKNVIFEMTCDDLSGEDVEVPYVMLKLDK